MTDDEFKLWTRHTADNVIAQRDDAEATRDKLQQQVDTIPALEAEIARLKAEIESLQASLPAPPGPREITPEELLKRFSPQDIYAIDQSQDPRVVVAKVTLQTRSSVIDLDSPVLAGMLDALIEAGIEIDDAERARILA